MAKRAKKAASAGHQLGQLVGDWFEEHFALPLLQDVARELDLFLDHRFRTRAARSDKLVWQDDEGNGVDYDFVMELDGSESSLGIPVAFIEGFWRRGARHSKDKARDDCGKLAPMRGTYPTARFLGIIAAGDFTAPARQYVQTRHIDLFYVPKAKVVSAFQVFNLSIDYPDRLPENKKSALVRSFKRDLSAELKPQIAHRLRGLVGDVDLAIYVSRVRAAIGALPQELRFIARQSSKPAVFESIDAATAFLTDPHFNSVDHTDDYVYQITYTDGTEFERSVGSIDDLRKLHHQIVRLGQHVAKLILKK